MSCITGQRRGWARKPGRTSLCSPPAKLLECAWARTAWRTSWRESRACEKYLRNQRTRGLLFSDWVLLKAAAFSEFFSEALCDVLICLQRQDMQPARREHRCTSAHWGKGDLM